MDIRLKLHIILALTALALAACSVEEPDYETKPVAERTVLSIDEKGNIYNLQGELVKTLPDCEQVTQIITDEGSYFVAGVNTKMKVGYWKNGKWNTLHVDFIDDVDHWTFGIAKWDYNIYLLDYPNVLRNSGIFRLEDCENFNPARHGLAVSEGYCFVVGADYTVSEEFDTTEKPVLYYYHKGSYKKKILPMPEGVDGGIADGICAFDGNHYLACGYAGKQAIVWDDADNYQILPRTFDYPLDESIWPVTMAAAVERIGTTVYVSGMERNPYGIYLSTVWTDGVPQHLIYTSEPDSLAVSIVLDTEAYSTDLYVLTQETLTTGDVYQVIWMNGEPIAKFEKPIISLAVY